MVAGAVFICLTVGVVIWAATGYRTPTAAVVTATVTPSSGVSPLPRVSPSVSADVSGRPGTDGVPASVGSEMFIASRADTSALANRYVQVVLANPDVVVVQAALAGQLSGTWVFWAQQTGTAALPCRPNPGPVGKELTQPYEAVVDPHSDGVFDVNFGYLCGSNIGFYINLHRTDSAGLWQINAVATPDELGLVSK
ncbi:MAG: hypothetical protein B5766_07710 [Candidatus Lumbricidophila eiseniae]|uniref:Uncharacterized protein n=1 Tax=Candidatus Lumbricidiphila eiseniae TaxID=1969409 RepID=A0A2A6FQN6_9MICO|nr:MAG: hypothetical protein B5766_07710 [Candidatus Lumbricidophila eiseniae]